MYYLCTFFDHSLFTLRLIEHWCYNTIRILHLRPADPSQHDPIICKKQPLRMFFKISFFLWWKHSQIRSMVMLCWTYISNRYISRDRRSREAPARLIGIPRHLWMTLLDALIYLDLVCMRFSKWKCYLGKLPKKNYTPEIERGPWK